MKYISLVILLIAILLFVGCDHTDLEGEIKFHTDEFNVDEEIFMTLTVPESLDGIYREMWRAIEVETDIIYIDEVIYGEELLEKYEIAKLENVYGKGFEISDRYAVFIPPNSGEYIIDVEGFYKQTNPQPIVQKNIVVK